jgi:hypothetical protein
VRGASKAASDTTKAGGERSKQGCFGHGVRGASKAASDTTKAGGERSKQASKQASKLGALHSNRRHSRAQSDREARARDPRRRRWSESSPWTRRWWGLLYLAAAVHTGRSAAASRPLRAPAPQTAPGRVMPPPHAHACRPCPTDDGNALVGGVAVVAVAGRRVRQPR